MVDRDKLIPCDACKVLKDQSFLTQHEDGKKYCVHCYVKGGQKISCDKCDIIKEPVWMHQFKDGKKLCGSCYSEQLRKEGNKNLGMSDWTEDQHSQSLVGKCKFCGVNLAQINQPSSEYHNYCYFCYEQCEYSKFWQEAKHCSRCGKEQERRNGFAFCKTCDEEDEYRPAYTSKCEHCKQEIKNVESLCPCQANKVFGDGTTKRYKCKTCSMELYYENSTCQRCWNKVLEDNHRINSRIESVPLERANDYTFEFCPWCSQDMKFSCNDDWTLNNTAVQERRIHLSKCSNVPEEVKERIANDHKKFTDEEISQQIKNRKFRKTADVITGNFRSGKWKRDQEILELETEIARLEKKANRTSGEQKLLKDKKARLSELNNLKVQNAHSNSEGNANRYPFWPIAIGTTITILIGIWIWRWIKKKKGLKKPKTFSRPRSFEKAEPIEKVKSVNNSPSKKGSEPTQSFTKKNPTTPKHFTCSKCQLVYKENMRDKNGNCKVCK